MTREVEVWIDADVAPAARVGTLHDDRGQIRFRYDRAWKDATEAFQIDPDLSLDDAPFFPNPEREISAFSSTPRPIAGARR